jgi:choline dehydrogenase
MFMVSHADLTEIPAAMALIGAPTVFAVAVSLQRPRSRGRVSLVSPDPHAAPRIELNYLDDGEDMRRMVEGLRLAWRVAEHAAIRGAAERIAILTEEMMDVDEVVQGYLQMAVSTLYHPVGTARMGSADDPGAVVDQYGRVRGLDGVRVLDASIMPNIPRANTNLTCVMLAERAAGWLREG